MLRFVRLCERLPVAAAASRRVAVLALAMAAGGCSAGFEMPTLSYNGGPAATSSVPIPREPVYSNRSGSLGDARGYGESSGQPYGQPYSQPSGQAYSPPSNDGGSYGRPYNPPYERQGASQSPYQAPSYQAPSPYQPPYQPSHQAPPRQEWRESNRGTPISASGERGVRTAGLPPAHDGGAADLPPPAYTPPSASVPYRSVATVPVTPPAPPRAAFDEQAIPAAADGTTIEVASGDTLYALSKKHGVPVSALMRANNLTGPQLRVGQKLVVPSSAGGPAPRRVASLPTAPMAEPAPPPAPEIPPLVYSNWAKLCSKDPKTGGKTMCRIGNDGRLDSGTPMVGAVLMEMEGETRKMLQIMLPLGILLPRGTRVLVDNDEQGAMVLPIVVCAGGSCMAQAEASADLVAKLKKGQNLYVQAYNMQQSVFTLALPLDGFAKAYDGPATDPKDIEQQNQKLQEQLRKRGEQLQQQQQKR